MINSFIWADLSTFDVPAAQQFYKQCFGWRSQNIGDGYHICQANQQDAAGLYQMPDFFQKINMPSFWMSYIRVQNINETVRLAEQLGGKIEIRPEPTSGGGQIALIRDPSGAGFTCYEGEALGGRDSTGRHGRMIWNELHISDFAKANSFYTALFQWDIRPADTPDRYEIYNSNQLIGGIQVTSNEIKGSKEYWGVYFAVNDLNTTLSKIERAGGQIIAGQPLDEGWPVLAYDPQGAAFYIVQSEAADLGTPSTWWSSLKWWLVS